METTYMITENGTTTTVTGDEFGAMIALMLGFGLLVGLLSYLVGSFLLGKVFKKAGVEQWKAWVPIYNNWVTLELGGQKGFWAPLMLVPVVNIASLVFFYIAAYNIGLKLQKEGWFVLLMIFLPIVWLAWLAFDKSTWQTAGAAPVDFGAGEPPMPEGMSAFGAPVEPSPAPEASPAEAAPSDSVVPPIEPLPSQSANDESITASVEPTSTATTEAEPPQPVIQSPDMVAPIEPTPESVAPATPQADAAPVSPEASQPAVEYPSVDGILSPTEPTASVEAPGQQTTESDQPADQSQPPVPPTQQ